ncbi:ABC transporter ATP-binding protein [Amaricoccus sp. W119]|uniref:ABC transporter ATP-binding protein n=1 Tax=Amaricoccus sp. W119 TaxID=3391833 RepID=UPI0039A4447A
MAVVQARNITVAFGAVKVIEELDIDIREGEFIVLLGPSGCGKSTLLNCIAGLQEIADGQIWIGDNNVTWAEPADRGIGMVFQSYALYPRMTVRENLSFGLRMSKMAKAEIEKRVARAAGILKIENLLDRRPSELSGGQRQRVAIGRALVRDVDVFLFDEPLSNLDAKLRTELRVEIKKLHQDLTSTMIYVTHDQIEALTLADRIAVLNKGNIQQFASPKEIYARPNTKFVASFVGSPSMNFLKGALTADEGGLTFVTRTNQMIDLNGYATNGAVAGRREVELGLRPEQLSVGAAGPARVMGEISVIEPMGADALIWFRIGDDTLSVRVPSEAGLNIGESIELSFDPAVVSVFDAASGERV